MIQRDRTNNLSGKRCQADKTLMSLKKQIRERLVASGLHLLVSVLFAAAASVLVYGLWYPGAFRDLADGTRLLLLIMTVDVVLGPMLTFAVFDRRKGRSHLQRDISTIALIQMVALMYGIYTVYLARPVALVFEHDRFRVISAVDVLEEELPRANEQFRTLSLTGPRTLAVRKTVSGDEKKEAVMTAVLDGVDTSQRPTFWIHYGEEEKTAALRASRSVSALMEQYPSSQQEIAEALASIGTPMTEARFLPVRARTDAVAILDKHGSVAGFVFKDGYF